MSTVERPNHIVTSNGRYYIFNVKTVNPKYDIYAGWETIDSGTYLLWTGTEKKGMSKKFLIKDYVYRHMVDTHGQGGVWKFFLNFTQEDVDLLQLTCILGGTT